MTEELRLTSLSPLPKCAGEVKAKEFCTSMTIKPKIAIIKMTENDQEVGAEKELKEKEVEAKEEMKGKEVRAEKREIAEGAGVETEKYVKSDEGAKKENGMSVENEVAVEKEKIEDAVEVRIGVINMIIKNIDNLCN
ncbi:Protein of unknown function [Cotesia congregata]|uniref:Uncharacterized protein n=1 Tax=Cotesia congregata TaxID=51543 RepID=A0A8J2MZ22_COTCN|nr:Protein of unknown function [Cotesia congregata]